MKGETLKRYLTAPSRLRASRGFGIHSPFAFDFVRRVLTERTPYYSYDHIKVGIERLKVLLQEVGQHPRVISFKNAKLVFRVVCRFNPAAILQIGTSYGISTVAALEVDTRSRMVLCAPGNPHDRIYHQVTAEVADRIDRIDDFAKAVEAYDRLLAEMGGQPFALVNDIIDDKSVEKVLRDIIAHDGVVIVRNISRRQSVAELWQRLNTDLDHGMSFSNGQVGIIVGLNHLPRQSFALWF